ncbi:hypothetical protein HELRODRAFT_171370 [Helobdella robusta]|uniref:Uncharacterized protein n=1 Tax=Helobdella robusta TaxID=6412 RepID=T1F469_HELRO|nr:hypothetical protein HELRODRAFT_171370 [Helobdella robusta]ESO05708.1 hypothetical protein HELRODRAFT_171370 [Helobdella robusta]
MPSYQHIATMKKTLLLSTDRTNIISTGQSGSWIIYVCQGCRVGTLDRDDKQGKRANITMAQPDTVVTQRLLKLHSIQDENYFLYHTTGQNHSVGHASRNTCSSEL